MHQRILEEATQLFVLRGYHGVSMREISEACGVTKAALYYHFTDKSALLLEILNAHLDEVSRIVSVSCETCQNARERLAALVHGFFQLSPQRRAIIRLASQEMVNLDASTRREFSVIYEEKFIGRIRAIFEEGMTRGDLRPLDAGLAVWVLLGMMYPFLTPQPQRSAEYEEKAVTEMLRIFFEGVSPHAVS